MKKGAWNVCCFLALMISTVSAGEDWTARARKVRKEATISYSGRYEVACARVLVERALDHPLVMGALWASYGYAPAYRVSGPDESGCVHVEDPTGIVGDVRPMGIADGRRIYLAEGKFEHWAVPALNAGTAVFEVEVAPAGPTTRVTVDVFLEPDSRIAGAVMWMLSPVIKAHIENRITLNFQDAAGILEKIAGEPKSVAGRLQGDLRQNFEKAFHRSH